MLSPLRLLAFLLRLGLVVVIAEIFAEFGIVEFVGFKVGKRVVQIVEREFFFVGEQAVGILFVVGGEVVGKDVFARKAGSGRR